MLPIYLGIPLILMWGSPLWVPAILVPMTIRRRKRLSRWHVALLASCEFTLVIIATSLFADVPSETFHLSLLLWPVVIALFSISALVRPRVLFASTVLFILAVILVLVFCRRLPAKLSSLT